VGFQSEVDLYGHGLKWMLRSCGARW